MCVTENDRNEEVEFIHEDDGRITATDLETGIASFGDSKSEALAMLAKALELYEGGGEPVTDEISRSRGVIPTQKMRRDFPTL